jgi:hypothetical protein
MKPCSNHRERIAWLALGALEARQERELRAHLTSCAGCRHYLQEIAHVTDKLGAVELRSDIQTSESFHQNVANALRTKKSGPAWETVLAPFRAAGWLNWRITLPAVGTAIGLITVLSLFLERPLVPSPVPTSAPPKFVQNKQGDPAPTFSTYRIIANQSLDRLDELLTRQGNKNAPAAPIYTASTLIRE